MHVIDLRSDTVTRPTPGMRRAMAEAEVGDDGYEEDPSVRALEEQVAALLGHEAGLFVVSGTMGNQVALRTLAAPGEVVLVGRRAHLLQFELGASARNAGVQLVTLADGPGHPDPEEVAQAVAEYRALGHPVALIALENTHMPSGGRPIDPAHLDALLEAADGTPVYIDGARIWNAAVALGVPPARLTERAVMVSACLSKGLGAPMGSVVVGDRETIARARRERARLGGRLRQAGIVAAGGSYALAHHLERLRDDHARAKRLAALIGAQLPRDRADCLEVPTNVLLVRVPHPKAALGALREAGVLANVLPEGVLRFVTHLGVDDDDIEAAAARIVEVLGSLA